MDLLNLFAPLTKVDAVQRLVYGTLVAEEVDKIGEIFDYETSKPFIEEWSGAFAKATDGKSMGNLRSMHGKVAAGKFLSVECDDKSKRVEVCAKVVDDAEWKKVEEGVYTGFSIGGSYVKKWADGDHKRYTGKPSEGSLVDNPCGPSAGFTMIKEGGATELRKFATPAADPTAAPAASAVAIELEQVWKAKDGQTFATKALAKEHNDTIAKAAATAADPATQLETAVAGIGKALTKIEEVRAPAAAAKAPGAIVKRDFTDEERKSMAKEGAAMSDGSYPIANKGDLSNAIQSFGRAKNKVAVKAHIKTRAKTLGAEDMLPESWAEGAEKALVLGELRKGLYTVSRFAQIIEDLEYLQQSTEMEASYEQDNSTMPAKLKEDIANLCSSLRAMVEEETNELFTNDEAIELGELLEMSAHVRGTDALAKVVGARGPMVLRELRKAHTKEEATHVKAAHDDLAAAGADCPNMTEAEKATKSTLVKAGARHGAADQAHLDSAHEHLGKMGYCAPGAEKMAKAMSKEDEVHLNSAHDHVSKMGIGCGMSKSGARHSKADAELLTQAHNHMVEAGADCPEGTSESMDGKVAPAGDLTKFASLTERNERLEKVVTDAVVALKSYDERLVKLEAQPMPRPHEGRGVDKSIDDPAGVRAQQEAQAHGEKLAELAKSGDSLAVAKYLMQMAQQRPQTMVPAR